MQSSASDAKDWTLVSKLPYNEDKREVILLSAAQSAHPLAFLQIIIIIIIISIAPYLTDKGEHTALYNTEYRNFIVYE